MHFTSVREMLMIVSPLYKIIYSALFLLLFFLIGYVLYKFFFSFDDVIGTDFRFEGYTEMRLLVSASAI